MAYTTINKSSLHFNTKLYTGNNTSQSITGVGFQPDWSWIKSRVNTEKHVLQNAVIGTGQEFTSQDNSAQNPTTTSVTSFNSDGITVGSANAVNDNNINYASWHWKANGAGSSNTDGSINTTKTSANTTSGFSLVTYTGTGSNATIGHGLGIAPEVVFIKGVNFLSGWYVYAKDALGTNGNSGKGSVAFLENEAAFTNDTTSWQNTDPTSSVISLGNDGGTNGSNKPYQAYCFAPVKGFSKMGSYLGNGNANGTFVYTGFKPAWILIKVTTIASNDWHIFDSKRLGYNEKNYSLKPNNNPIEVTGLKIDLLSNGFKLRGTQNDFNGSGQTYMYMAFAEAPLVGSNNIPATAR